MMWECLICPIAPFPPPLGEYGCFLLFLSLSLELVLDFLVSHMFFDCFDQITLRKRDINIHLGGP